MARRKKEENAVYECINTCTVPILINGQMVHKLFRTSSEVETSEERLKEGGSNYSDCMLSVPQGTIVCHHFAPHNDVAEDDREDQLTNPGDYIKDDCDLRMIAELMVDEGWFRDKEKVNEKGRIVLEKTDVQVACDSILEQLGEEKAAAIEDGDDVKRVKAINALLNLGKDEKETRKKLFDILSNAEVKIFKGAETRALAERILEEGLYDMEEAD